MPISISEFDEKGTEPSRAGGFSGKVTSGIMTLLKSENSAFSLTEVAEASDMNMEDETDSKTLMNVLYVLRTAKVGKSPRQAKITMKAVDGVKHYRIATDAEIAEALETAEAKAKEKAEAEPADTAEEEDEEAPEEEDDGEEEEPAEEDE